MGLFARKKTVYYPGSTLSKYAPEIVQNWKSLLSDFGIIFTIDENLHSGWSLWDQGYYDIFREHIKDLKAYIKSENIKEIITSSPEALYIFTTYLPEIKSRHTTQVAFENLPKIQQFNTGEACFHDNTTQVRRNDIISEGREILVRAGFSLKEFAENKKQTQCLGTSTGLVNNSPRLATKLAIRRVRLAPSPVIITDSPEDYLHMKRSTTGQVHELSEVLVEI